MGKQEVLLVIFATYDEHIPRVGNDLCAGIKNNRSPDVGLRLFFCGWDRGLVRVPVLGHEPDPGPNAHCADALKKPRTLINQTFRANICHADGGSRTRTMSPSADFESAASAISPHPRTSS